MTAGPSGSDRLATGDTIEVEIERAVYRGRGLGRHEGRVVFVPRSFPGDRVRARVLSVHAGYAEAEALDLVSPSPERRRSPCPYVPRCGGCAYQELSYAAQLRAKEAILRESLVRAGAAWEGPIPTHPSPEEGWRMRASLHFAVGEGRLLLGLHQEGTRRVVDVERCLQLSASANEVARTLRAVLAGRPALHRYLRGCDLIESPDAGTRVAVLQTALAPHEAPSLAFLAGEVKGLAGLGVATGPRLHWLFGPPHVEATALGIVLRVHARSFFQANRFLYEPLARAVLELLPPGGRVLDLYAGVGLFALPAAARGAAGVVAVEKAATAVEDARTSARRAGLDHVRFIRADVGRALSSLRPEEGERIVLDPPRTGVEEAVIEAVAARRPEVVLYVSCDPPTLGRDLARLSRHGYRPDAVQAFDLFPDTFHVETVVRLRRR